VSADFQRAINVPGSKDLNSAACRFHKAGFPQGVQTDLAARVKAVQLAEVDDVVFYPEHIVKAALLGQAFDEGQLAPFESRAHLAAGACFLALKPAA
jgi:hypothetical protein